MPDRPELAAASQGQNPSSARVGQTMTRVWFLTRRPLRRPCFTSLALSAAAAASSPFLALGDDDTTSSLPASETSSVTSPGHMVNKLDTYFISIVSYIRVIFRTLVKRFINQHFNSCSSVLSLLILSLKTILIQHLLHLRESHTVWFYGPCETPDERKGYGNLKKQEGNSLGGQRHPSI